MKIDGYIVSNLIYGATCDIGVGPIKASLKFPFEQFAPGCVGVLLVFEKESDAKKYADTCGHAAILTFYRTDPASRHPTGRE